MAAEESWLIQAISGVTLDYLGISQSVQIFLEYILTCLENFRLKIRNFRAKFFVESLIVASTITKQQGRTQS
ncbi:hypothetical protein EN856_23335 [Mesorhizobium sp. M8A.F.Ca.ET.213.01.1.1]|uniref:hypothetical protein n=1 Tax=Mesorhizobium sp. M8A.F.Ca.ET.213.01.1.1 TaxID=2563970 RepID=UPI001092574D|nr:hypothetical protein [Mesorhizobium sp. M8A.F.Ca.ET.213.01.1.1]TGT16329.1 hypothetical protein EN856_23335 [Mesorhizobium sp. M8A.F.Ca.ET.213.01.1.1]TIS95365.1 MAG: hypothetical protein E5W88_12680 [Mesorhizobium sp.]